MSAQPDQCHFPPQVFVKPGQLPADDGMLKDIAKNAVSALRKNTNRPTIDLPDDGEKEVTDVVKRFTPYVGTWTVAKEATAWAPAERAWSGPLPQLQGDIVTQIGVTVHVHGADKGGEPSRRVALVLGDCAPVDGVEVRAFADERALLLGWRDLVRELDPDVLTGCVSVCLFVDTRGCREVRAH